MLHRIHNPTFFTCAMQLVIMQKQIQINQVTVPQEDKWFQAVAWLSEYYTQVLPLITGLQHKARKWFQAVACLSEYFTQVLP
jgi:hypothetical protein